MVQTRSSGKRIQLIQATADISVEHPAEIHVPIKKRQRKNSDNEVVPKKRRRGRPSEMCQLNLDVLFIIAAYLRPLDLLNLARTCKSLRQLLMDKSSEFVWKTARRQVYDLPDCPVDLTEPEYANLVFYARCHGCGKHVKTVFWEIRRRYCSDCRIGRLCPLSSCHEVIRWKNVLAKERITAEGEATIWVDREQMESFIHDYKRSSHRKQLVRDKRKQHAAISMHARQCEQWQSDKAFDRKVYLEERRRERENSIFERLKELGYEDEITYFGPCEIKRSCKAIFGKSKPLTDQEWNQIFRQCTEIMDDFYIQRITTRSRGRPKMCRQKRRRR